MGTRRVRDMTPNLPAKEIEHEQKVIETMTGWKRDARKLLRVTPESIAEFDVSMDRIIARSRARIARLKAEAD
jgi:hypothetical protein